MKRCARKTGKVKGKLSPTHRLVILVSFALSILISPNLFAAELSKQPTTLKELIALSPAQLENCDIARMNLLCAEGLPGSENLKVDGCLATLDEWAQHIKSEIGRNFHHYVEDPAYYYNSTNFYKMLMMAVVLYEDYNVRYNPKWIEAPTEIRDDDHFAADSRDILISGLVGSQRMGTCSSMPVLYVALARRLTPNWKSSQLLLADAQQRSSLHYVPLNARISREQQALDLVPDPPGVKTGTPKIPDPDPLKQLQMQNPNLNIIPNP